MLTNEQLKNISPVGLVNPAPELTNIVIPNTFEEKFGDLLNRPMPKPIAIAMPDVSPKSENYMGMRLQGLAGRVINDLSKKDPNFNNPVKRVITTPLSEMEPYLKYDSNYDSKIGAAFGQAGKGIVVGGLAGTTTAPGIGTAIGAATLGTAGFLSGLLAPSGRGVYIPGSDNRKRMLKEQEGFWSTMGGFTNNLIDRAFEAGVGGTAALLSSPIGAFSGKDFHEWGSNPLTERLAQGKEQSEYKRHLSDSYLAKNPIAKFFTPEGFQNEFADMAGFTLGMMVGVKGQGLLNKAGGSLVSSVLSGTELAANITARNGNLIGQLLPTLGKQASKMFTQGVKAERIGLATTESTFSELGLMNNAKNLIKDGPAKVFNDYGLKLKNAIKDPAFGLGALSAFERTTLASYGEGRVEAAQAFKDIYQEAIKRGFTEGEAQQMATSGANKTLFGNLAILGITNQFGLNQLMKPSAFKNLAKWFTKDWVIDNTSKTLFKNMLVAIGKNAATGAVVEGLFEELGQYAVSEAAKNQQFNMADLNNPVHKAFFYEFIDAYKEGFKTDEGISNLFGGAMFGALMGAFGMEGATGMFFERKEAAKLNIPPSIKTSITEMTKAANFIAQHSAPFNGQLFTSYSEDEDGNLVPDANGTIRMSDDPTRLFQLTKALSHIVTLSKDQANTLLTSVVNKLDSTNPKDKAAFNSIKDYLEQYGDEGKVSLEQYINQNLSPEEKYNTLRLIDALSRQEQGIREEQLNQLALELTKSNYVYDFVANGVEDRLFDEIDQLERSLSTFDTAAQKDQIEFFGKLYQKSNFNEAKKDLEEFRKSLSDQVTLYNSLANRYSQPFTTLALKNKEGKTIRIPVQVDMKQVFRSALIQKNYEYALKRIVEDRSKAEAELLSEPGYKEEYFKTDNTSEDVIEAAKKFKEKSKSAQELNLLDMLEKHYLNSLKDENKNFADLTDREKLIKEAKKAEEVHNNFVESTPTLTDKNVNPVPPTTSIQDNETEDNGEEDEPPVTDTESQTEDVEQPVEEVPAEEQPVAQQPEDEAPTNEYPIQNEEPPFTEEPPVTDDSKKEPKENKQSEEVKKTEEQPPNEPPVDIDEGDVVEDDYVNGAKTPFSAENIFKTYAADVVNGRFVGDMEKVKFLNNMNGASGTISLLAIPVKSKLGKIILSKSDNDRDFYKNYVPANPELIYLFVKRGSVITTSDKLIPLTDLFKMTEDQIPPLMFDKSTTFRKEKDGWRVGHKLKHITSTFSQLENYTEEEINIIVRAYNDEMRQLEQDAMDFLEGKHNDISRLSREISGLTPGMEHSFDPANPLKLREIEDNPRLDIELPTQERAKLDGLKVGSPYVKYTTQEGKVKYFRTKRTKLSDQQVNVVSDIMIKYLKNETLSPDEIAYLYTVVNWFGSSLYENNATSRNAVGVVDNTIVFNPHSVNAFSWSLSDPISALNNRLREYYHFVNNSTLTKAKNTQYKDLVTGTVYNNYQDYLIKTKALLFYAGKNVDVPIKSNIQVIFKPRVTPNVENKTPQRKAIVSITELLKNKDNFLPDSIQTQILNSIDSITFKPSEGNPMIHKGSFEVEVPVIIASSIIEAGVAEGQVVTLTNKSKAPITANVLKNYSMVNIPESAAADPNTSSQRVVISLFKDTSTSPVVTYLSVESPLQKEEKKKEETKKPDSKKIDNEEIKKINASLGESILGKLGYKKINRQVNGNVKGGQSGWKVRFNIKSPTGENYFNKGYGILLNDKHYNEQAQKLIDWLNVYFETTSKGTVQDAIKGGKLFGFNKENPSSIWKFLSGGEQGESDFTIYIGSADDLLKFVNDVKSSPIANLLVAGNQGSDVNITEDGIFKARIEGADIGFSGYHVPTNLNRVSGSSDFTFIHNNKKVYVNYNGPSISDITVYSEETGKGYNAAFDQNMANDLPELFKNIRNILGFQIYGEYLEGTNSEMLKLIALDKKNTNDVQDYDENADELDDEDFPNRSIFDYEEIEEIEDIDSFKAWLQNVLPQFSVVTEEGFIDNKAQGQLFKNLIRIYKGAGAGTGYHEAFEAVWAYMLSPKEKEAMLKEFKSRPGSFEYYSNKQKIKYSEATDYQAKEMLAEGMIDFMKNRKLQDASPKANNFFMKLWNMLVDFINSIRSFFGSEEKGFKTIEEVYDALNAGKFSTYKITEFDATANRDRFDTSSLINYADVARFESLLHDRFITDVLEENDRFNIFALLEDAESSKEKLSSFLNKKLSKIIDVFAQDYLDNIKKNPRLINSLISYSNIKDPSTYDFIKNKVTGKSVLEELRQRYVDNFIKTSKLSEFLNIEEFEETEKDSKEGIVAANEINPSANVNNVVRFLLGNLYYLDNLGRKVYHEDDVFGDMIMYKKIHPNKAQKELRDLLANTVDYVSNGRHISFKEVVTKKLEKAADLHPNNSWMVDLVNKLKLNTDSSLLSEDDFKLQISFLNSFKKAEHVPVNMIVSENGLFLRNAILDSNAYSMKETWTAVLKKEAVQNDNINPQTNNPILLPPVTKYKKGYDFVTQYLKLDIGKPSQEKEVLCGKLQDILYNGALEIDDFFMKKANSTWNDLSLLIAKEGNMKEKSFRNHNNRQQFAVTNPTATSDVFNRANSVEYLNEFVQSNKQFLDETGKLKVGIKRNLFVTQSPNNPIFRLNTRSRVKHYLLNGATDLTKGSGKSFAKMSFHEKLIFKANAYFKEKVFSMPINSDKSMENAVSFVDNDGKGRALIPESMFPTITSSKNLGSYAKIIDAFYIPALIDELELLLDSNAKEISFFGKALDNKQLGYFQNIINFTKKDFDYLEKNPSKVEEFAKSKVAVIDKYLADQVLRTYSEMGSANLMKYLDPNIVFNMLDDRQRGAIHDYVQAILSDVGNSDFSSNEFVLNKQGITYGSPEAVLGRIPHLSKQDKEWKENRQRRALQFLIANPVFRKDLSRLNKKEPGSKKVNYFDARIQQRLIDEIADENLVLNIVNGFEIMNFNLVRSFTLNYQVFNMNVQNLIYGSPLMYKQDEFAKRASAFASAKQPVENSVETNEKLDAISPRFDNKKRDGKMRQVSYDDPIVVSSDLISIAEGAYLSYGRLNPSMTKEQKENIIGATFDKKGKFVKIKEGLKNTIIEAYTDLKIADAQAMMMPDAIFDLMFKSGKATKSFLKQFRYQMAYERYQRSLIPKQSKMAFARYIYKDKVLEKQDLAIIKKGQPDGVIQVLKPQGSGYLDGYNSVVPVFLKNSVLPLFWSRVENNPELAKRYIDWQKNQIDLIGFHSGQKIGNVTRNGKLIKLYDHTGKTLSELPPIQEMDATYFGLQVETPNKYKNKVNRGVQITKLITSNLTSLYGKKGHENITELVDSYYENLNALWTKGEEDLHKKLGIKYNITTDAYEIKDINHLIETLKGEVRRLDLPISVEDLFNIDPTDKKLAYSFDVSTERNRIEYILNSILDSTLIHQKVKGTQSPQISSVFERIATSSQGSVYLSKGVYVKTPDDITKLTPEEQKSIKLVSTDLRIRKDGTIEVYLPSYLRGISDVNDKKIDKRLLDLIGYRIPTQSLGQVEKIRVMGFLDQSYGDAIVVPSEIVGKAGSDFDIDKLTLYFPNYYVDKKGNLKYYEYSSDPDKVKDRYNQYIKSKEYDYFKEVVRQLKEDQDKKFVELGLKGAKVDGEIPWTKLSYNKLPDAVKKVFRDINEKIDEDFATRKAVGFEKGVTKTVAFMEEAMDLLWEHEEDLIDNTGVSYEMFNEETGEMEEVIYGEELIPIFKKMIKEYEAALEKYGVVAEDLDVLKQNLAAFRQLKDENQDYIKSGLITDITSKFGLISFDDFSQLSTSEQNSREALENRNIEIMSKIISLPENRLQHIAPNSAATIKAVDLDLNKQDKENHTFLSEVVESTKMRHTLLDAKNLVGVGALNVTGHSIAQLSEMVINTPEYLPDWTRKELFNLDKNNPYGLNKIFDEKGVLISSNLSEFLSAFVDAAKDPFAVRLNLNFKTINEAMLLVRLGLSIEKTLWFLNQDTIRDFVYNLSLEDSTIKKASNDVVSRKTALVNTIEKYMTEIEPTIFENFDVLYPNIYVRREAMLKMTRDFLNSKKVNAFYTADNLKMGIDTKGSKNQYNGTLIAIKALLDFEKMKDLASELSQVNSILNIESTKTNSFLGNQLLLEKYLKNQALEKPLIGNVKKAFEITHLKPVLNYRMSFRKYLKPFLRITQGPLSDVLNKAAETLSKEYKSGQAKLEILDKFTNFVLSHMLNKNYSKEEIEELLIVGGNNLNTRISNLKQNYKKYYKDFGKPFDNLGTIFTTVDGKRYENIKINITKEDTTLRNVEILKYENLYKKASTPSGNIKKQERREFYAEAKAIIEDLVKVSIHQSGTFSSSTSLSTTLPAEIYSRTVTDLFDKMPDPENFDILWEQFHQNFWSDRSIVPVYKKDFIGDDDNSVKKLKGALRQKYVLVYKTEEKDIDEMDFEDSFFDQVKVNPYLLKVVGAPQEAFDENNKKYIFTPVVILPRLGNRSSTGKVSYGIETYDKPLTMEDVPRYHSSDVVYEYTDDQVSNFLSNFTPKQDDPQSDTIDVDFTEVDNEQKSISSNPLDTDVITSALIALVNIDTQSDIALKAAKEYLGFTTEEDEKLTIEEVLSESALNLEGLNALLEYIKTKIC